MRGIDPVFIMSSLSLTQPLTPGFSTQYEPMAPPALVARMAQLTSSIGRIGILGIERVKI